MLLVFGLRRFRNPRWLQYSTVAAAVIIVVSFGVARTKYIYRDQNADRLTKSLDGVLPGGRHIYTNENTFQFMMDLDHAVELAEHENKLFAILPDVAAYWVKAPQQNPLPAVWPHAEELTKPALLNHYIQAMEERRSDTTFIVQKVDATQLANGFAPLPSNDYYPVVRYARQNFTKIQETKYFELYK